MDACTEFLYGNEETRIEDTSEKKKDEPKEAKPKKLTVNVHINDLLFRMPLGGGKQSCKWLALAAVQKYENELRPKGFLRQREHRGRSLKHASASFAPRLAKVALADGKLIESIHPSTKLCTILSNDAHVFIELEEEQHLRKTCDPDISHWRSVAYGTAPHSSMKEENVALSRLVAIRSFLDKKECPVDAEISALLVGKGCSSLLPGTGGSLPLLANDLPVQDPALLDSWFEEDWGILQNQLGITPFGDATWLAQLKEALTSVFPLLHAMFGHYACLRLQISDNDPIPIVPPATRLTKEEEKFGLSLTCTAESRPLPPGAPLEDGTDPFAGDESEALSDSSPWMSLVEWEQCVRDLKLFLPVPVMDMVREIYVIAQFVPPDKFRKPVYPPSAESEEQAFRLQKTLQLPMQRWQFIFAMLLLSQRRFGQKDAQAAEEGEEHFGITDPEHAVLHFAELVQLNLIPRMYTFGITPIRQLINSQSFIETVRPFFPLLRQMFHTFSMMSPPEGVLTMTDWLVLMNEVEIFRTVLSGVIAMTRKSLVSLQVGQLDHVDEHIERARQLQEQSDKKAEAKIMALAETKRFIRNEQDWSSLVSLSAPPGGELMEEQEQLLIESFHSAIISAPGGLYAKEKVVAFWWEANKEAQVLTFTDFLQALLESAMHLWKKPIPFYNKIGAVLLQICRTFARNHVAASKAE